MTPRMMPRTMADVPVRPERNPLRPRVRAAIGPPSTMTMRPEATIEASSGMITTGMRPRSQRGTSIRPMA